MMSRNFRLQKVGDLSWLNTNYNFSRISFSIDELIVLDVSRAERNSLEFCHALQTLTKGCFVPIAAGGGVRSIEDARKLLRSGADKIVVNTLLYEKNGYVKNLASEFGTQCIVGSMDIKTLTDGSCKAYSNLGSICQPGEAVEWIEKIVNDEIGELYLNSIDRDGTGQGYDFQLLNLIPKNMQKPLILSGGVGNVTHLAAGLNDPRVDAVATANLFNFIGDGLKKARQALIADEIVLPFWDVDNLNYISIGDKNSEICFD